MAWVKIHAGDFFGKYAEYKFGILLIESEGHRLFREKIPITELEEVEIATEDTVKSIGGAVGWGAAGALLFGPAGAIGGMLLGGKKKEVTFVAKFKDGRKLLASTDNKTFTKLKAAVF